MIDTKTSKTCKIRKGDKVRIVDPQFFVRCGYPKTIESELPVLQEKCSKLLDELLIHAGVLEPGLHMPDGASLNSPPGHDIMQRLTYWHLKRIGFGGKERSIYTEAIESFRDKEYEVLGIRFVKTGTYNPGFASPGHDGWEFDPPYLCHGKTHRLLLLKAGNWDASEIEDIHVQKIIAGIE